MPETYWVSPPEPYTTLLLLSQAIKWCSTQVHDELRLCRRHRITDFIDFVCTGCKNLAWDTSIAVRIRYLQWQRANALYGGQFAYLLDDIFLVVLAFRLDFSKSRAETLWMILESYWEYDWWTSTLDIERTGNFHSKEDHMSTEMTSSCFLNYWSILISRFGKSRNCSAFCLPLGPSQKTSQSWLGFIRKEAVRRLETLMC